MMAMQHVASDCVRCATRGELLQAIVAVEAAADAREVLRGRRYEDLPDF